MPTLLNIQHQMYVGGAWTTYDAYQDMGWSYTIGPDVDSGNKPNKLSLSWQNPNLTMDPSRADSPLYGLAGRNTPTRILVNGNQVLLTEAAEWKPERSVNHTVSPARGLSWVDMTAEGLLRRIGQWTTNIASAMARQIGGYAASSGLISYSRLEDKAGAATLANDVAGVRVGSYTGGVTLGGNSGPGGSDSVIALGTDGAFVTYFAGASGTGYQLCWAVQMASTPASATYQTLAQWTDTRGRTFTWQVNNTNYGWTCTDADGTVLLALSTAAFGKPVTSWMRMKVKVTITGSTLKIEPSWYLQDDSTPGGVTYTFAVSGTVTGSPKAFTVSAAANSYMQNAGFAHLFAITNTAVSLESGDALRAFNGFIGESAILRWNRLAGEAGLTRYTIPGALDGTPMGRQKPGLLLDLLQECIDTDGGLMYDETITGVPVALTMAPRSTMINKTPKLALTRSQISYPFRRRLDTIGKANVITANNATGEKQTVSATTGPLSLQPPPAGIGEIRASIDVNVADPTADLLNRAYLELARSQIDRVRYESLTVDLLLNPGLSNAVSTMRPGDWITVTGEEPDVITLIAINWTRSGDAVRDTVTINCLPADAYQVAVIDDAAAIIDSSSSSTTAGFTSTATTFGITTVDPVEAWSTTSAYDLMIAGERIGVPAGGMSAPSGTGPVTQTVTGAVRSKNGVVKAQLAAAAVVVADPVRIF